MVKNIEMHLFFRSLLKSVLNFFVSNKYIFCLLYPEFERILKKQQNVKLLFFMQQNQINRQATKPQIYYLNLIETLKICIDFFFFIKIKYCCCFVFYSDKQIYMVEYKVPYDYSRTSKINLSSLAITLYTYRKRRRVNDRFWPDDRMRNAYKLWFKLLCCVL